MVMNRLAKSKVLTDKRGDERPAASQKKGSEDFWNQEEQLNLTSPNAITDRDHASEKSQPSNQQGGGKARTQIKSKINQLAEYVGSLGQSQSCQTLDFANKLNYRQRRLKNLEEIFKFYDKMEGEEKGAINLTLFWQFCRDFDILDSYLNKKQITKVLGKVSLSVKGNAAALSLSLSAWLRWR